MIKTQDVVFTLLKREKEMNVREREREMNGGEMGFVIER